MRYLGIDYGTKRIGVAVSDDEGRVAFPLTTVAAGAKALSEVAELTKQHGAGKVVLGESRDFKGAANPVQEDIEQFKKDLEELSGLSVVYEQEFLTSAMAERQGTQPRRPVSRPRVGVPTEASGEKLDAAAAALILQSYLDRNRDTL